jgi:hypothetical protein
MDTFFCSIYEYIVGCIWASVEIYATIFSSLYDHLFMEYMNFMISLMCIDINCGMHDKLNNTRKHFPCTIETNLFLQNNFHELKSIFKNHYFSALKLCCLHFQNFKINIGKVYCTCY